MPDPEPTSVEMYLDLSFGSRVSALLDAAEESVPKMTVLVWGPSEDTKCPWWNKRVQIRDELKRQGFNAYFSEELPTRGDVREIALRTAELAHAKLADFIIVLMSSVGAVAEFHDFGQTPDLARKMLVFIDQDHMDGYAASLTTQFRGANGILREIAVPDDLDACNVLTTSLEQVNAIRELKVFTALQGFDSV